ncbi:MAG: hypothetical protein HYZ53_02440 [Planctomycetes bacterium]|nr:hypothetical protein [Planctomycetota bacterium]
MTEINEVVQVGAVFGRAGKKIQPAWFVWSGQRRQVAQSTYTWTGRDGDARVHHFSIVDEKGSVYELTYHAGTLVWRVAAVQE